MDVNHYSHYLCASLKLRIVEGIQLSTESWQLQAIIFVGLIEQAFYVLTFSHKPLDSIYAKNKYSFPAISSAVGFGNEASTRFEKVIQVSISLSPFKS